MKHQDLFQSALRGHEHAVGAAKRVLVQHAAVCHFGATFRARARECHVQLHRLEA